MIDFYNLLRERSLPYLATERWSRAVARRVQALGGKRPFFNVQVSLFSRTLQ